MCMCVCARACVCVCVCVIALAPQGRQPRENEAPMTKAHDRARLSPPFSLSPLLPPSSSNIKRPFHRLSPRCGSGDSAVGPIAAERADAIGRGGEEASPVFAKGVALQFSPSLLLRLRLWPYL